MPGGTVRSPGGRTVIQRLLQGIPVESNVAQRVRPRGGTGTRHQAPTHVDLLLDFQSRPAPPHASTQPLRVARGVNSRGGRRTENGERPLEREKKKLAGEYGYSTVVERMKLPRPSVPPTNSDELSCSRCFNFVLDLSRGLLFSSLARVMLTRGAHYSTVLS